jgi:hypothetical protein
MDDTDLSPPETSPVIFGGVPVLYPMYPLLVVAENHICRFPMVHRHHNLGRCGFHGQFVNTYLGPAHPVLVAHFRLRDRHDWDAACGTPDLPPAKPPPLAPARFATTLSSLVTGEFQ